MVDSTDAPRPDRGGGRRTGRADPRRARARRRLLAAGRAAEDRAEAVADPHSGPGGRAGARDRLPAAAAPGGADGLRGAHRRPRRPPARETPPGRAIEWLQSSSAREIRDRRGERRRSRVGAGRPRVRERRRHRQPARHHGRGRGHRAGRRVGVLRPHPVRRLQLVSPATRGDVRDAGRAQARPLDRDRARRRVPCVRSRRAQPGPLPLPASRAQPRPLRGRRRGADAGARRARA